MTPSRKPSRATVITATVAIGVFGAGAGLGAVIAVRPDPGEGQVMRLAAGTYLLDDQAGAWSASASSGDRAVALSGADAGSSIADGADKGDSTNQRICLTTTSDGHAVGASGGDCAALPVLAVAAAAAAPVLQRPGNPKSTPTPPKATTPTKPAAPKTSAPATKPKPAPAPVPPPANPGPVAPPVAPPVANPQPVKAPPPPAPTPTEKVSGNISQRENGSVIESSAKPVENVEVVSPPKPAPEPGADKRASQPPSTGGNRTSQPQPQPTGGNRTSQPRPSGTLRPSQPGETVRHARPTGTLNPAIRSGTARPIVPSGQVRPPTAPVVVPPATRPTDDAGSRRTRTPGGVTPAPAPSALPTAPGGSPRPVQPSVGPGENTSQGPKGTVLTPADPQLPGNPDGVSLPVFNDPELLRRAHEALGLDRGMRYTDENGVWDLNIAPPGTPPCRDYTAAELQALSASQGPSPTAGGRSGQTIPRDSCLWPAFIRWLYAEPVPGEVSNWTKFTGLPQRNLELVVTDPAPATPPQPVPAQSLPASDQVQPDPGQSLPAGDLPPQSDQGRDLPPQPDPGRLSPAQPGNGDGAPSGWERGENDRDRNSPFQPDQDRPDLGRVEPDPVEYDGQ